MQKSAIMQLLATPGGGGGARRQGSGYGPPMASAFRKSLVNKAVQWARSPEGQRKINDATRRAQQAARDPATRAKLQQLRARVGGTGKRKP
jgi:hypothetical protein